MTKAQDGAVETTGLRLRGASTRLRPWWWSPRARRCRSPHAHRHMVPRGVTSSRPFGSCPRSEKPSVHAGLRRRGSAGVPGLVPCAASIPQAAAARASEWDACRSSARGRGAASSARTRRRARMRR